MVVTDASVLVNFLRIDRMALIAGHSHAFIVTDHVADEVSDRYPDQQQRFAAAVEAGGLSQQSVTNRAEITLFGTLSASGRLGAGECSAKGIQAAAGAASWEVSGSMTSTSMEFRATSRS